MAMLQQGFHRRLNGQDVSFLSKSEQASSNTQMNNGQAAQRAGGGVSRFAAPTSTNGAAGLHVVILSEGGLEQELCQRISLLAQAGVDTSNDQELARALQDMLDREVEEEATLRVCRQLEQEDADRLVALRLNEEEQVRQKDDRFFAMRLHQNTHHGEFGGGTGAIGSMECMSEEEQDRAYAMRLQQEHVMLQQ